jgi:glycosyltransferase involved in cell wall biosynthesis
VTPPVACTIVANNYLAYARAFSRSFLERHPDGKVCVLIVDRPYPGHDYGREPFAVTFAAELAIPEFSHVAFRYSILELSTAVKPSYLLHLHRTLGCDRLCYFDPDIMVLGDFTELYERLGHVDAVLTPHLTAPLEDSLVPSERDILQSGIYNLGFLGLSFNERTLPFLDWWARRLYRECRHDVVRGLFVDQRWMDFAPSFLPRVEILRDPGYNAAYWNLPHRRLSHRGDQWWIDGVPLRFFHFSGYDVRRPDLISKFQNRLSFDDRPDARPLFTLYRERLEGEGHAETQQLPYGYGWFDAGVPVPAVARLALHQADPHGKRWRDPFSTAGPDTFLGWLRQPVDSLALPLPRFALMLWDIREDLQRVFPRPWKDDAVAFARWFARSMEANELMEPASIADLDARASQASGVTGHVVDLDPPASWFSLLERRSPGEAPAPAPDEIRWLTADAGYEPGRRPRVPRLAMEIHRRRFDVRGTFPDPLGADREGLALWYTTFGRYEYDLPYSVIRPVLRTLSWRRQAWAHVWWRRRRRRRAASRAQVLAAARASSPLPVVAPGSGVASSSTIGAEGMNVIGWATAPTGVGEACRGTLAALAHAGVTSALWKLDWPVESALRAVAEDAREGLPFEVSLYHVNAGMMDPVQRQLPRSLTVGRYRIGYWFWELAHFPLDMAEAFGHVDEVWAPTRFCLEAYRPLAPVGVRWMPPCVPPTRAEAADRVALGVDPQAFLFGFVFDAMSVPERKNPRGLLAAFAHVVGQSRRPVHLLLKVNHADAEPAYVEALRRRSAGLPVTLMTGTFSRERINGLIAACDAYVSLHRSEGLGLPLIEAMYLGKPVIATGYAGVTDFLDEETGYPVRYCPTALETPHGPYPAGAVWAEPNVEHAAARMLALVNDPQSAAPRIEAARQRVHALYAPEAAGARLRRELDRIRGAKGP